MAQTSARKLPFFMIIFITFEPEKTVPTTTKDRGKIYIQVSKQAEVEKQCRKKREESPS
jgi:hypothetical protein